MQLAKCPTYLKIEHNHVGLHHPKNIFMWNCIKRFYSCFLIIKLRGLSNIRRSSRTDTDHFCPLCRSHSPWEDKFSCESSISVQVNRAEHLPDTKHVALYYLLESPGILVVLFPFSLFLLQGREALPAHYLK